MRRRSVRFLSQFLSSTTSFRCDGLSCHAGLYGYCAQLQAKHQHCASTSLLVLLPTPLFLSNLTSNRQEDSQLSSPERWSFLYIHLRSLIGLYEVRIARCSKAGGQGETTAHGRTLQNRNYQLHPRPISFYAARDRSSSSQVLA